MKKPSQRGLFPADRTGLEPATSAVTGRHSNQLNYRSFSVGVAKIGVFSFSPKQKWNFVEFFFKIFFCKTCIGTI